MFKSHPSMIYYMNLNTNDKMSISSFWIAITGQLIWLKNVNCLLKCIAFKFQGHDVMYHSTNSNYS